MLSTLSNQGKVLKPQVIHLTAGKKVSEDPFSFLSHSSYPFQEPLLLAGINFPLFTESLTASYSPLIHEVHPEIKLMIPMPAPVQKTLLEGMNQVIWGHRGTARPAVIHYLYKNPAVAKDYKDLKGQFVGKTGTAEILYKQWLDAESLAKIHNHIWFGGVLFPEGTSSLHQEDAELVVVVYLRFSEAGGKEAAPIAAQMGKKWRELQKKHQGKSYLERMSSISKKVAQNRGKASAP